MHANVTTLVESKSSDSTRVQFLGTEAKCPPVYMYFCYTWKGGGMGDIIVEGGTRQAAV